MVAYVGVTNVNQGRIKTMEIERVEVTLKTCKNMTDQLESLGANIITEKLGGQIVKKALNDKGKTLFKAIINIEEALARVSYPKGLFDRV